MRQRRGETLGQVTQQTFAQVMAQKARGKQNFLARISNIWDTIQ